MACRQRVRLTACVASWGWVHLTAQNLPWSRLPTEAPLLFSSSPSTRQAVLFLLGRPIVLPVDTTPFVLPQHMGTKGAMATVGLSQDLFDSVIMLLQKAGALNLDVTAQLVRAGPATLGTRGRSALSPSLGRPC